MDGKMPQNVILHYLGAMVTRIFKLIRVKMKIVSTLLFLNINRLQIVSPHRYGFQECQNSPEDQSLNQSYRSMVIISIKKLTLSALIDSEPKGLLSNLFMKAS
jgi:hypothetical protein